MTALNAQVGGGNQALSGGQRSGGPPSAPLLTAHYGVAACADAAAQADQRLQATPEPDPLQNRIGPIRQRTEIHILQRPMVRGMVQR